MRNSNGMGRGLLIATFLVAGLFVAAPAYADSFNLNSNNLGIGVSIGTVTDTCNGAGTSCTVSIVMNSGFSIKLEDGNDVGFNLSTGTATNATITELSFTDGTPNITSGITAGFGTTAQNIDAQGSFQYQLSSINAPGAPPIVSADDLQFTITGTNLTSLQNLAVHFCTASGTNCGPQTGFGSSVPEPTSLLLLGAGLAGIGLSQWKRRKAG